MINLDEAEKQYLIILIDSSIESREQLKEYCKSTYKTFKNVAHYRLIKETNKRIKWLKELRNKINV